MRHICHKSPFLPQMTQYFTWNGYIAVPLAPLRGTFTWWPTWICHQDPRQEGPPGGGTSSPTYKDDNCTSSDAHFDHHHGDDELLHHWMWRLMLRLWLLCAIRCVWMYVLEYMRRVCVYHVNANMFILPWPISPQPRRVDFANKQTNIY